MATAASDSAATEHTEVPQLAELVNQEASSGEKQIVATEHADDSVPYAQASDALQLAVVADNAAQGAGAFQSVASPMPSTLSGSSGPRSDGAEPSFDIDARGWKIIHVPIAKHSYRIRCGDKIVHVPPQSQILTVAVNPARTMPDEWTLGGVAFFVISLGNTDESE